jgi:hypothetical protein
MLRPVAVATAINHAASRLLAMMHAGMAKPQR